jgi:nicotinamide mononucleotide transporter
MSITEISAVVFALAYIVLAIRESAWCWLAGFYSVAIYLYICYQHHLYLEALFQVVYLFMSVYGYMQWIKGSRGKEPLRVTRWGTKKILITLASFAYLSAIAAYVFANYTEVSFPFLDAPITAFSLIATYMLAKKYIESWLFWIVIDLASVYLFAARDLKLTAIVYGVHAVLAIIGYFAWKKNLAKYPV